MRLTRASVTASILAGTLLCLSPTTTAQTGTPSLFATHVDELSKLIQQQRDKRQQRLMSAIENKFAHPHEALFTTAAPDVQDQKDIAYKLLQIVADIRTGTASVFSAAGLSRVDITINNTESVWQSNHVRNGYDKARPFLDVAGNVLIGVSLFLTASQNPNSTNTGLTTGKGASAATGVAALALGSLLQHYLGSKKSQLTNIAGAIDGASADMAQIAFSRAAYDEINNRFDLADKYYKQAYAQIDVLASLQSRVDAFHENPASLDKPGKLKLIDDIAAAREQYQKTADFVDAYTDQLDSLYAKYAADKNYEPIKAKILKAKDAVDQFQTDYRTKIQGTLLVKFPTYAGVLTDLRAEVGQEQ